MSLELLTKDVDAHLKDLCAELHEFDHGDKYFNAKDTPEMWALHLRHESFLKSRGEPTIKQLKGLIQDRAVYRVSCFKRIMR